MGAAFDVDQLNGHPQAVAGALHRPLQGVAHVERLADLASVDGAALVGEGRVAGDHEAAVDAREVGRQALGDAVDEILLVRVAREIGEGQDHDRKPRRAILPGRPAVPPVVGPVLGDPPRRLGGPAPADEFLQARQDLAPLLVIVIAVPVAEPGALDLVERQGRQDVVQGDLDQLVGASGQIGLGAHPLRAGGGAGPKHDHRLGVAQPLLDHLGIGAMGRQLVVPPHREPAGPQGLGDLFGPRLGFTGVGDEDVGHRHPLGYGTMGWETTCRAGGSGHHEPSGNAALGIDDLPHLIGPRGEGPGAAQQVEHPHAVYPFAMLGDDGRAVGLEVGVPGA